MKLEDFFLKEVRDNSEYSFEKIEKNYKVNLFNNELLPLVELNGRNKLKEEEINLILSSICNEFNLLLNDKKFVEKNLYLFNEREYEHNTGDNIFEFYSSAKYSLDKSRLNTGNIVGFISKKHNSQIFKLAINSRFGNNFLKYLISYSDGFLEIPKYGDTSENGMAEWILIFLWKIKLKYAFRLGIPKEYVKKREKINTIRGNLSNKDMIENIKLIPNYECNFKEHSYNNSINRLISNTFRFIKQKELISDIVNIKNDFHYVTEGKKLKINELMNYTPVKNSFYSAYNDVAELSKKIILNQMQDIGNENSDTSAFLFDVSMLFEHFIRKVLINNRYSLEEKNLKSLNLFHGGSYNGGKRNIFSDIIIKNSDGSVDCFDVKYKNFDETYGIKREDLFQIYTYASTIMNEKTVNRFGIIYPGKNDKPPIVKNINIAGKEIKLEIHFFNVPQESSSDYNNDFKESIKNFSLLNNKSN